MSGQMVVQVGDKVKIPSAIFTDKGGERRWMKGTVVWLHPLDRFAVVAIQLRGGIVRECCQFADLKPVRKSKRK